MSEHRPAFRGCGYRADMRGYAVYSADGEERWSHTTYTSYRTQAEEGASMGRAPEGWLD